MKVHTTNYKDPFIEIAPDCPAINGEIPPLKTSTKTVTNTQFEMVSKNPYKFTSDDIFFQVFFDRSKIRNDQREKARTLFFSREQPCFRTSPLTKRYGWGIHFDSTGKVAIYGVETSEYKIF